MTVVCASEDLAPGEMVAARHGALPIVVLRGGDGELRAFVDRCLHQGARLSGGRLLDHTDGERVGEYRVVAGQDVLKCPWHGYEYDAATGCGLFDRRRRLRPVPVHEEDGWIVAGDRVSAGSGEDDRHVDQPGGLRDGSAAR